MNANESECTYAEDICVRLQCHESVEPEGDLTHDNAISIFANLNESDRTCVNLNDFAGCCMNLIESDGCGMDLCQTACA